SPKVRPQPPARRAGGSPSSSSSSDWIGVGPHGQGTKKASQPPQRVSTLTQAFASSFEAAGDLDDPFGLKALTRSTQPTGLLNGDMPAPNTGATSATSGTQG